MFYLTYRPAAIEEIDNSKARPAIESILSSKKIPHAFLFIGQKGTGKTSTARIFAKAVNCLKNKFAGVGNSPEPCNECANCKSITASSSADVTELDAASNRGIDEIRALIREASLLPMNSTYRVFIIDEAHMITNDAFNALLKTLEEPPASVIFILATTNSSKIPSTILSRCVTINFGRARRADILGMLKRICKQEKITIDPQLLDLISRHSEDSFRDAAKMLEELVIQKKLTLEEGKKFLGILGKGNLLEILEKKTLKDALLWIEEFSQAGGDIKHLLEQLLDDLRRLLLAKNNIALEEDEDGIRLNYSISEISQLMKLLGEAYNNMRISPIESIPLEIAVVDFYNNRKK